MARESSFDIRSFVQRLWDSLAWLIAVPVATALRFDLRPEQSDMSSAFFVAIGLAIFQFLVSMAIQSLRGNEIIGSFDDVVTVFMSASFVAIVGTVLVFTINPTPVPRSVPVIAGAFAAFLMLAGRFAFRVFRQRSIFKRVGERAIIYGAGNSGEQIIRQMLTTAQKKYVPLVLLDDDPRKRRLRIHGVKVVGSIADLGKVARITSATTLIVAIVSISASELSDLDRRVSALGLKLRVIPTTSEIIDGTIKLGDISHVTEEDLLGRRPIHTDEDAIAEFLAGKRILITGAGGSIGSELARQVHRYHPAFVGILDRDESAIHALQLSINGRALLTEDNLILADIRDSDRMREVMTEFNPDIVFHAAALKHLPLLERYPEEAHKTNVLGTLNVLQAAQAAGVYAFINISTDKAADPISVLGRTKFMTEQATARTAIYPTEMGQCRYLSVRFGNVLGSRGSVLTAFRYQIEKGGPVTVTDPKMTRYFMTIPEAVHLVLQAGVIGDHGETLILDMGEPVSILSVAQKMIEKSGRDIEIVFTGLREGEKLDEICIAANESATNHKHPLIMHSSVDPATVSLVT